MSGRVLEAAPNDGLDNKDFPDLDKEREPGLLPNDLTPEPKSGFQLVPRETVLRLTGSKSKKDPRPKGDEGDEQADEAKEGEDIDHGDDAFADVEIIGAASGRPPLAVEVFQPFFLNGKGDLVLVADSGLKSDKVET